METSVIYLIIYVVGVIFSSIMGYASLLFYTPPALRDQSKMIPVIMITGFLSWVFVAMVLITLIVTVIIYLGSLLMGNLFTYVSSKTPKKDYTIDPRFESTKHEEEESTDVGGVKPPLKKPVSGQIK